MKRDAGATLVELIVTIVVATLIAGLILSSYVIVVRLWHGYNYKMEASGGAWVTYLRLERLMSQSYFLRKAAPNKWVFYKGKVDSCELIYRGKTLLSSDSTFKTGVEIDSFHLEMTDTTGLKPVWECGFVYFEWGKRSALSWRTLCKGAYVGGDIPVPMISTPVESDLYWDNAGK